MVLRLLILSFLLQGLATSQDISLRGRVNVIHQSKNATGSANVVVWLTPTFTAHSDAPVSLPRLSQKDKKFSPHVIAIRVGTEVEFPNQDPFFHDVFSIYRGKPFDLGLYESGTSRKVRFTQPGVSYIFCNIHPEMSAAVVAVPTPYFTVTSADGSFQIGHLSRGHYKVSVWYELSSPSELDSVSREIDINDEAGPIQIDLHSSDVASLHLNKYGQDYPAEKSKSY